MTLIAGIAIGGMPDDATELNDTTMIGDVAYWHVADLLPIVRHVRCRRMNGPAQDAAEGLSLTERTFSALPSVAVMSDRRYSDASQRGHKLVQARQSCSPQEWAVRSWLSIRRSFARPSSQKSIAFGSRLVNAAMLPSGKESFTRCMVTGRQETIAQKSKAASTVDVP